MITLLRFVWMGLLITLSSCNHFVDRQPEPDNGPPAGTLPALFQYYPQAENVRFTTISNNQLWQVDFTQDRLHHQALMGNAQLLVADQLLDGSLPDSLTRALKATVFSGGVLARPRFHQYEQGWSGPVNSNDPSVFVLADYTWQQQRYTAYWSIAGRGSDRSWYNLSIVPFQRAFYSANRPQDIPQAIQTKLREENLTFLGAQIQVDALGQSTYSVSASASGQGPRLVLTYDHEGQLIAVRNQATAQFFQQVDQLPPAVQTYLGRPELVGFSLAPNGSYARHTYGSLTTYEMSLEKGKEAWELRFSPTGQLINSTYHLFVSF